MSSVEIKCLNKFGPLLTTPKRVKIIVGGRGSTKSTFIADRVAVGLTKGELWACGREFQNSIDESVHRLLLDEIGRLGLPGFNSTNTSIEHESGGRSFYIGLARNILSLKGKLSGITGLWIEEGEGLSEETLRVATASVRTTAAEYDAATREGRTIVMPEIWISMNRGSREDPIAKRYLERAEPSLARTAFYEDEEVMIVQANYTDMPKKWFLASGLETERASDEKRMSPKQYRHKWLGDYIEAVDNAIIKEEWFDACVDAHVKLKFKPEGFECVTHDPSDEGDDAKGLCHRHGSVILHVEAMTQGNVNQGMDWALDYTLRVKADAFKWDGDGLGLGLRAQVAKALGGKRIEFSMFRGGETPAYPDQRYDASGFNNDDASGTNKDLFANQRAQFYRYLADRMYNTYVAVQTGTRFDLEKLISFSSSIPALDKLRSELARIPVKRDASKSKLQLLSKPEMKSKYGIPSPNLADAVMMSMSVEAPVTSDVWTDLNYAPQWVV